jgi:hypothetical protein
MSALSVLLKKPVIIMTKIGEQIFHEQFFWAFALKLALGSKYYFSEDCERDFKIIIRRGVKKLIRSGEINQTASIKTTEASIKYLIKNMIHIIKSEDPESNRLREHSLRESLQKLCPCFPFC